LKNRFLPACLLLAAAICSWTPALRAAGVNLCNSSGEPIRIMVERPGLQFRCFTEETKVPFKAIPSEGITLGFGEVMQIHLDDAEIPVHGFLAQIRLWWGPGDDAPSVLLCRIPPGPAKAELSAIQRPGQFLDLEPDAELEGLFGAPLYFFSGIAKGPKVELKAFRGPRLDRGGLRRRFAQGASAAPRAAMEPPQAAPLSSELPPPVLNGFMDAQPELKDAAKGGCGGCIIL
jgi:hypothetical protein